MRVVNSIKTLKVERAHMLRYDTRALTELDIVDWIERFYNRGCMHSSIGYQTPADAESSSGLRKVVHVESRQGQGAKQMKNK